MTPRNKDKNNAELHAVDGKGQCCDSLQGRDSMLGMTVLQGPTCTYIRALWIIFALLAFVFLRSSDTITRNDRNWSQWRVGEIHAGNLFSFFSQTLGRFCIPFYRIFWTKCRGLGASSKNGFRNSHSNGRSKRNQSKIPSIIFGKKVTALVLLHYSFCDTIMVTNKRKQPRRNSERDLLLLRPMRTKGGRVFQHRYLALDEVAHELVTLHPELFACLSKKSARDRLNLLLYKNAASRSGEGRFGRVLDRRTNYWKSSAARSKCSVDKTMAHPQPRNQPNGWNRQTICKTVFVDRQRQSVAGRTLTRSNKNSVLKISKFGMQNLCILAGIHQKCVWHCPYCTKIFSIPQFANYSVQNFCACNYFCNYFTVPNSQNFVFTKSIEVTLRSVWETSIDPILVFILVCLFVCLFAYSARVLTWCQVPPWSCVYDVNAWWSPLTPIWSR